MKNKEILCTICAREGSQGVKNKNLKIINKIPLIAHSILQAKASKIFSNIIVSSDSKRINKIALKYGAEVIFKRPSFLATSKAPKIPVLIHAVKKAEKFYKKKYDIIVDLDPTSPLRKIYDIKDSIKKFKKEKSNNLFSVSNSRKNPYFNMVEVFRNKIKIVKIGNKKELFRRQDSPKVYDMNASIYIWDKKYLLNKSKLINEKTSLYLMPEERSIDIDTKFEFKLTKFILENEKLFR